jgi:hypothetical protein
MIDRYLPTPIPNGFWCTNSAGLFVDDTSNAWPSNVIISDAATTGGVCSTNQGASFPNFDAVVSPQAPDSYEQTRVNYQMQSLAVIQSNAPIDILLNGGEYDMQVPGWGSVAWLKDPRVQAATNGLNFLVYESQRKAYQLSFLTAAIKQQIPNRTLSIFYEASSAEETRVNYAGNGYLQWGWDSRNMVSNTDLPSYMAYYSTLNLGSWTNNSEYFAGNAFNCDMLTRILDAVGYNIALGHPLNYTWVEGGGSATDSSVNSCSDIPTYTGFLKCMYTAGMVGGIAEYSAPPGTTSFFWGPGNWSAFSSTNPPDWLLQMMALSHTHALFSHLANFLYSGTLLSGPQVHVMSTDQPAYEFTNTVADPYSRVLARKLNGQNQWLVTAWNSNETTNTVTVNIPTIGNLTVTAVPSASVYEVTMTGTNVKQTLQDEYTSYNPPPAPLSLRVVPQ